MTTDKAANPIQTTQNSFDLLKQVAESNGLTLSELDSQADLSKGAIYNHLATLQDLGIIVKRGDTFYPSLRTYQLGDAARKALPGTDFARKQLWELADSTGEFSALVAEEDGAAIVMDIAAGPLVDEIWASHGDEFSLYRSAAGKIILSQKSDQRIRELCGQSREDIDVDALVEEIKTVKVQGLAFSRGEYRDEQYSVAAPVLDGNDNIIYVITLIGPKRRLSGKSLQQDVAGLVVNTANEIERNLY